MTASTRATREPLVPRHTSAVLAPLPTSSPALAAGTALESSSATDVTPSVRAVLEPGFQEANGFGFRSFACERRREGRERRMTASKAPGR